MIKFSIIILCPDCSTGALKTTTDSIKLAFSDVPYYAVVGENAKPIMELSKYCPVHKGGETITSLIDEGIKHSTTDWNLVVMAGSWLREHVVWKYQYFARSEKDILYPVIDRKIGFDEASINGIYINKIAMKEVGDFGDEGTDIKIVKLFWALDALKKGYHFKAIVGAKLF